MRSVGERMLLRYDIASVVAAESMAVPGPYVSNLLVFGDDKVVEAMAEEIAEIEALGIDTLRVMVPSDWDGLTGSGGTGGSRYGSFVSEPFIAA
jgi:hypothetical protein